MAKAKPKEPEQEVVEPTTQMELRASAMEKATEARKGAAMSIQHDAAGWGLPTDSRARVALMAITAYYGLDPVMGDIIILGDSVLYITEQAYKKKLQEQSKAMFDGKQCRWIKRPATPEEVEMLGYGEREKPRVWYVELWPPEGCGTLPFAQAYGEADRHNMTLINSTKQTGDPRVLNRMAIKRAEHECMREFVTFRLPAPADFEATFGMAMDEMLQAGVQVVLDDGIMPQPDAMPTPELPDSPNVDEVTNSEAGDAQHDLAADDDKPKKGKKSKKDKKPKDKPKPPKDEIPDDFHPVPNPEPEPEPEQEQEETAGDPLDGIDLSNDDPDKSDGAGVNDNDELPDSLY
jgi:hypothetical protein